MLGTWLRERSLGRIGLSIALTGTCLSKTMIPKIGIKDSVRLRSQIEKGARTANFTFWLLVNTVETREATIYYDCNRYLMTTNVYVFVIWIFGFLIGGIPLLKLKRVLCFHLDLFLPQPGSEHLTNTGIQKQLIWYCGCPMNRRARVAGAPRSHI